MNYSVIFSLSLSFFPIEVTWLDQSSRNPKLRHVLHLTQQNIYINMHHSCRKRSKNFQFSIWELLVGNFMNRNANNVKSEITIFFFTFLNCSKKKRKSDPCMLIFDAEWTYFCRQYGFAWCLIIWNSDSWVTVIDIKGPSVPLPNYKLAVRSIDRSCTYVHKSCIEIYIGAVCHYCLVFWNCVFHKKTSRALINCAITQSSNIFLKPITFRQGLPIM